MKKFGRRYIDFNNRCGTCSDGRGERFYFWKLSLVPAEEEEEEVDWAYKPRWK